MATRAVVTLREFNGRDLSNTVWALAKLQHNPGQDFLLKVAGEATKKITSFSPQGLVNLALAFACFDAYDKTLMDVTCREVESKLHTFNGQDLESLTWALARLGHRSKTFEPYLKQPNPRLAEVNGAGGMASRPNGGHQMLRNRPQHSRRNRNL